MKRSVRMELTRLTCSLYSDSSATKTPPSAPRPPQRTLQPPDSANDPPSTSPRANLSSSWLPQWSPRRILEALSTWSTHPTNASTRPLLSWYHFRYRPNSAWLETHSRWWTFGSSITKDVVSSGKIVRRSICVNSTKDPNC